MLEGEPGRATITADIYLTVIAPDHKTACVDGPVPHRPSWDDALTLTAAERGVAVMKNFGFSLGAPAAFGLDNTGYGGWLCTSAISGAIAVCLATL